MKKKFYIFTLFLLFSCGTKEDNPEQQIKNIINSIELGIEQRSLSEVTQHISDDYQDHLGRKKKDIKRYLQLQILRNQSITILSRIKSISISENLASVELSVATAARGTDLSLEENRLKADSYKASLVFEKKSSEWKITSSSWQRGW